MKKFLLCVLSAAMAVSSWSQQSAIESGKFYKVQHQSGLMLTRENGSFTIQEAAEDGANQTFCFNLVPGTESEYAIAVDNSFYLASDANWNAVALSNCSANYSKFNVTISEDQQYVLFQNMGQLKKRGESKCYLGVDNTAAGSLVYTDKNGQDEKHHWTIIEAGEYSFPDDVAGPDVYPEFDLPDDDPRKNAYPGYKLVFAEEFNAVEGQPDKSIWNYENGWKRNNENQFYWDKPNNIWFENGVCVINGRHEEEGQIKNPLYDPKYGTGNTKIEYLEWTSASIITKGQWDGAYSWQYGIYEVRAKIPAYTGCWPAIWSTGRQYAWPKGGEIDLMEWYGNCIHGNVCWGNTQWNSAVVYYNTLNAIDPETEWRDQYHIWRMFWDYDHIEMWCDDVLVNNINLETTFNPIQEGQAWSGLNPFRDVRQVLWLNLAMGGNSGGSLKNCPQNNYYMIDYARIYQRIGTDGKATYHVEDYAPDATIMVPDKDAELDGIVFVDNDTNSPVEYFNLQGIKIERPVAGQIVVRRQGANVQKVVIR